MIMNLDRFRRRDRWINLVLLSRNGGVIRLNELLKGGRLVSLRGMCSDCCYFIVECLILFGELCCVERKGRLGNGGG